METQPSPKTIATETSNNEPLAANTSTAKIIVCQNKTCKQQGSPKIHSAFQRCAPTDVLVEASGCLGQCGNGPMVVVVEPDKEESWHSGVEPTDVFSILARHFSDKTTDSQQSYQQSNKNNFLWLWAVGILIFFCACVALAILLGGPSHYG